MSSPDRKLRHSKTSKILVLISGIILFLFLVVSLFLGRVVEFSEEVMVVAPPAQILPLVADLRSWREWSVWNEEYYRHAQSFPVYETNVEGEAVRSVETQIDPENQKQLIVIERQEKSPERVVFRYSFWDGEGEGEPLIQADTFFTLTPGTEGTRVGWHYRGDYRPVMGWNPLQKYFLFFTEFSLKRAYRESLVSLKEKVEN